MRGSILSCRAYRPRFPSFIKSADLMLGSFAHNASKYFSGPDGLRLHIKQHSAPGGGTVKEGPLLSYRSIHRIGLHRQSEAIDEVSKIFS